MKIRSLVMLGCLFCCQWSVEPTSLSADTNVEARARNIETEETEPILHRLELDYLKELKTAKDPESVLQAEDLMRSTDNASNWTNFLTATQLLRQSREKASVPLLLRYAVIHGDRSKARNILPEYESALQLLTGQRLKIYSDTSDTQASIRDRVTAIAKEWWWESTGDVTTEIGQMSEVELQVVIDEVMRRLAKIEKDYINPSEPLTAYRVQSIVTYRLNTKECQSELFFLTDPRVPPILLDRIRESDVFPWFPIITLASMHKLGLAEDLDALVTDETMPNRFRLSVMLALVAAGQPVNTRLAAELLDKETNHDNRLVEIILLGFGQRDIVPVLLEQLEDPNLDVACAAAYALTRLTPPEALPILAKRMDDFRSGDILVAVTNLLGEYESRSARQLMVRMLQRGLESKDDKYLYPVLRAFGDSLNQYHAWIHAGANTNNFPLQTRVALAWYEEYEASQRANIENLSRRLDSLRTQLRVSRQIEELRRGEYKRLLELQGQGIVKNEESQAAAKFLEASVAETKKINSELIVAEAELQTLEEQSE